MSSLPPIKFQETLQSLIENSQFKGNRKPIWEAVHITSAALSQYLQGQTRPRLETLVGLAEFFGVSLDYLVLGKDVAAASSPSGPYNSYFDEILADVQSSLGARTWMAARIGQELAMQIEGVATNVAARGLSVDGIIAEKDVVLLEQFSLESLLLINSLNYNVTESEGGEFTVARFSKVIADNLNSNPGRGYDFLLPEDMRSSWEDSVHGLRWLLANEYGVSQERLRKCRFRSTNAGMLNGACFYRLDVTGLHHHEPVLYQLLASYVSTDGWIGYAAHVSSSMNSVLFTQPALNQAIRNFRRHWKESTTEL